MTANPYRAGNPVGGSPAFVGRETILRSVLRVLASADENAIVGQPRTGKTSLLLYLAAPEVGLDLYGPEAGRLLFSFLDVQTLGSQFTQGQFWRQALAPVKAQLVDADPDSPLARQYRLCQDNDFGNFTLEVFFRRLHEAERRLALLLDEFDLLLHHPILNSAEFFGGLRALASQSRGALALVVASRSPLARLNAETQELNPSGSPYFNIFSELVLGDFPNKDVEALLRRAGDRFTPQDRRAIRLLAGGHPFLLQAAAAITWDAYDEGLVDERERRRYAGQRLYWEQRQHFADMWRNWTPETRQAFTVVGLANVEGLLPGRQFHLEALLASLPDWVPELTDLAHVGLLSPEAHIPGGWRVTQQVMLWWLADELARALRSDSAFAQWLQAAQLAGRWTRGQRAQLRQTVAGLGQGVTTLIERFAAGLGYGMAGGPG